MVPDESGVASLFLNALELNVVLRELSITSNDVDRASIGNRIHKNKQIYSIAEKLHTFLEPTVTNLGLTDEEKKFLYSADNAQDYLKIFHVLNFLQGEPDLNSKTVQARIKESPEGVRLLVLATAAMKDDSVDNIFKSGELTKIRSTLDDLLAVTAVAKTAGEDFGCLSSVGGGSVFLQLLGVKEIQEIMRKSAYSERGAEERRGEVDSTGVGVAGEPSSSLRADAAVGVNGEGRSRM